MNKKLCIDLSLRKIEAIGSRYCLLTLSSDMPLPDVKAGQFVEVLVENSPKTFLRRPISIHRFSRKRNEIELLVAVVGDGTHALSQLKEGDRLNCVLPLGKGFTLPATKNERMLLIGGGVGIAPLLFLGEQIVALGGIPEFLLGGKTLADIPRLDMFQSIGNVHVTTEDGSFGTKGFVTQHPVLQEKFDKIACCGPKPMMMAIAKHAKARGIECEVSLENLMACGLGACLCCVEKTVRGNVCVCKEGPVFNVNELLWQI